MSARPIQKNMKRLIAAAFLTFVGLGAAPTAFARITANTIDPVATLTENGHHVIVTGPMVRAGEPLLGGITKPGGSGTMFGMPMLLGAPIGPIGPVPLLGGTTNPGGSGTIVGMFWARLTPAAPTAPRAARLRIVAVFLMTEPCLIASSPLYLSVPMPMLSYFSEGSNSILAVLYPGA